MIASLRQASLTVPALRQLHFSLPELAYDLLGAVPLRRHSDLPFSTQIVRLPLDPFWGVRSFRPVEALAFGLIADTDHLDDANMVLGLQVGGEAKAYPVGMLSYHHLVNDELGGEPFVATY